MQYLGGKSRIANDSNEYLIAMLIGLLSGENYPEQISPELYNDVNFLSRKTLGYVSKKQDFKSICVFTKMN